MDNMKVKAAVMQLNVPCAGITYKAVTWNEEAVQQRKILVAINYLMTKDNIVGAVSRFFVEKDYVFAEIILNTSEDEDIMRRLKRSIFLAGIETITDIKTDEISSDTINADFKKSDNMTAKITAIGMVNAQKKNFNTNGFPMWVGLGKCEEKLIIPQLQIKREVTNEEAIENEAKANDKEGSDRSL